MPRVHATASTNTRKQEAGGYLAKCIRQVEPAKVEALHVSLETGKSKLLWVSQQLPDRRAVQSGRRHEEARNAGAVNGRWQVVHLCHGRQQGRAGQDT